jgi:hypothetical protein
MGSGRSERRTSSGHETFEILAQIRSAIVIRPAIPPAVPPSLRSSPYPRHPSLLILSFHFIPSQDRHPLQQMITLLSIFAILCNLVINNRRDDETANIAAGVLQSWQTAPARSACAHTGIAVPLDFGMCYIAVLTVRDSVPGIYPGLPCRWTEVPTTPKLAKHLIYRDSYCFHALCEPMFISVYSRGVSEISQALMSQENFALTMPNVQVYGRRIPQFRSPHCFMYQQVR